MLNFSTQPKLVSQISTLILVAIDILVRSDLALAQLRLGTGIPQGLEGYVIEYQLQGKPLSQMQGISGCSVGYGAGCNKTASILQKIVQDYSGKSDRDILLEATGGLNNYSRFLKYYPESAPIESIPLNSFWIDNNSFILDRYENSGIGSLDPEPISGLYEIVSQFKYAPVTQNRKSLNLRQGLIGLKTAYGRTLLEEAQAIPDIEQKIAAFGLNKRETAFHIQQYRSSIAALNQGNTQVVNNSLYQILSNPYTDTPGILNRPPLGISPDLDQLVGVDLDEQEYVRSIVEPGVTETAILDQPDIVTVRPNPTPVYIAAGVGGLTLLAILLTNLGGNSTPDNPPPDNPPPEEPLPVPEPSSIIQFIGLGILGLLIFKKNTKCKV